MNFLTVNIRGAGKSKKADWIRGLKTSHGVQFLCIQETKVSEIAPWRVNRFWGRSACEFDSVDAVGRSGGIISIWDPSYFDVVSSRKNRRFLAINGVIKPLGVFITIVNVYASNNPVERKELWIELLEIRRLAGDVCIFLGDFNDVKEPGERLNSEFVASNAAAFNSFILEAELMEFQMGGGLFTYISYKGDKFSEIDRVLVCKEFMGK
ncbi:uncharacterized protein LOC143621967 [Bidens hawaiensis]|uniref:uncharacterized protein LOC143621967 n=1 Tax=Bidens hawaiensis TaxID=980011 RepID=UPI00404B01FA